MRTICTTLAIALGLFSGTLSAHQDFHTWKSFGNVTVRITTGFEYEEVNKAMIIGELAASLARRLNYEDPIFVDLRHHYISDCLPDQFISYDRGTVKYTFSYDEALNSPMTRRCIVIRQVASTFDARVTLKLMEYAISHVETIIPNQQEIRYEKNYYQWIINSIDTTLVREVTRTRASEMVLDVLRSKIERPIEYFSTGISYYFENEEFKFFDRRSENNEAQLLSLTNVYFMKGLDHGSFLVFDTDSSFYFLGRYGNNRVSKRHVIHDIHSFFRPFDVKDLGGGLISIHFWYHSTERFNSTDRNLLYVVEEDRLIEDLKEQIKDK